MAEYTISQQEAWQSIQFGIKLTSKIHPHIKDIILTSEEKSVLIKLYCDKRFVVYCAKFEQYFKINQEYVRTEYPPAERN